MKIAQKRILLTGAAGGIGSELSRLLAKQGAHLALLDRDMAALQATLDQVRNQGNKVVAIQTDLLDAEDAQRAVSDAIRQLGGIDILINNAGLMSFRPFSEEDPAAVDRLMQLNAVVPMRLARSVLPDMLAAGSGHIVNVGSAFGSIGFAWFAAYSSSKFALRGFSQALRRELQGTGVGVSYIAPRAVRTSLNSSAVYRMAEAVGMHMDPPDWVAARIVDALRKERKEAYLGFPESLFTRINALWPGLVDLAVRRQGNQMKPFAEEKIA